MTAYKELDPEETLRILQGYRDELSPEAKKWDLWSKQVVCSSCGNTHLEKRIAANTAFRQGTNIPTWTLRCTCGWEYDPWSNLTVNTPQELPPYPDEKPLAISS